MRRVAVRIEAGEGVVVGGPDGGLASEGVSAEVDEVSSVAVGRRVGDEAFHGQ